MKRFCVLAVALSFVVVALGCPAAPPNKGGPKKGTPAVDTKKAPDAAPKADDKKAPDAAPKKADEGLGAPAKTDKKDEPAKKDDKKDDKK